MIYLFSRPVRPASDWITHFETTGNSADIKAILPGTYHTSSLLPPANYPCPIADRWAYSAQYFSEVSSWELLYPPPLNCKPGLYNIEVTAKKDAFSGIPPDPGSEVYNGFIQLCYNYGCGEMGAYALLCDYPEAISQLSAAGDGSDAADMPMHLWADVPIFPPTNCCGSIYTVLRFVNGPAASDGNPTGLWSWKIELVANWHSDFAP